MGSFPAKEHVCFFHYNAEVSVILALDEGTTSARAALYDEHGKLRSFVNVYVNDEDSRYLQREDTPLGERDVVSIVPSIAGGKGGCDR